jgi:hypothetical protein
MKGAKGDRIKKILDNRPKRPDGKSGFISGEKFDVIPNRSYRPLLKKTAYWHKKNTGASLDQVSRVATTRAVVQRAAEAEDNYDLLRLCDDRIWWDRVVSVEDAGVQVTYAIQVDDYHTYISEDFVVHNTVWYAVGLPLWLIGRNENLNISILSSTEKTAQHRLETVGRFIEYSPEFREVFPWVEPDYSTWSKSAKSIKRKNMTGAVDPALTAYGYTGEAGQGSRTHCLIVDDVATEGNSCVSPAARETLQGMMTSQWIPRVRQSMPVLDRDGKMISVRGMINVIGTRYHPEDIYNFWMQAPKAYCTLVQKVSEDFTHLDFELYGAMKNPPHPIAEMYGSWRPPKIEENARTLDTTGTRLYPGY